MQTEERPKPFLITLLLFSTTFILAPLVLANLIAAYILANLILALQVAHLVVARLVPV